MTICKHCWAVFTTNLFSNSALLNEQDFNSVQISGNINGKEVKLIESGKLTEDDFNHLKNNKDKFFFIGKRKEYKDSLGFTKVEWN